MVGILTKYDAQMMLFVDGQEFNVHDQTLEADIEREQVRREKKG